VAPLFDRISNARIAGGRRRTIGPVATAKLLGMLYPESFCMWDRAITWEHGCALNGLGYARYLSDARNLKAEIARRSRRKLHGRSIDAYLEERHGPGRTALKLIDEHQWLTVSRQRRRKV
jgi:hypothetical protein